jgi:uncharacterized protein (DUF58 family)
LGVGQASALVADPWPLASDRFPGWSPRFAEALQRLSIPHRQRAGGYRPGEARSAIRGRALEFADYRPYVPGDEVRLIDWRAYGRFGRLFLKQQEEERVRTVTILIDVSASMDWGEGDAHKGRFARRLAAALAWIGVSHHDTVSIGLLRDGTARALTPVSARPGAVQCFRELGAAGEAGRASLAPAVHQALSRASRGPTILVSDFLEVGWPGALATLAGRREAVAIQLLAPSEWSPSVGDEVELLDAETGETFPTRLGTPELSAYARQLEGFLGSVQAECRRLSIAYVGLNTGTPLRDVLFRELPAARILE